MLMTRSVRALLRENNGSHAEGVLYYLVRAEQRHPGDCRRRGPEKDTREGEGAVRTNPETARAGRAAINLQPLKPVAITLETDLPYGLAVAAFRLPGSDSPDFAAGMILADALDNHRSNLSSLVPEGKALFTGFDGGALPKAAYGYALAAFPPGGDGTGLVAAIKNIIAGYVKNGVPADLVEASKRHEIVDAEFQKNSVAGLAAAWSEALAIEGRDSPDDDINAIRKVSVEDVNRVAREYLKQDIAVTAVLTPRPSGRASGIEGFQREGILHPGGNQAR